MAFKAYENDSGLMVEGDYEVICLKAREEVTRTTQKPVISFDFQVRSDVEQKYQRKHIFKSFYQDESGQWPKEKIGRLANALGIEKGREFELSELEGQCCILHMKPFTGQDGVARDAIFYAAATKAGQIGGPSGFAKVEDEELPF